MSLIDRIFGKRLVPAWEFSPDGNIWKLQPTAGGILFGEARDVERKQLSLFALRPSDGTVLFRGIELHEPWWISLEMLIDDIAIMHRYPRPDLPNAIGATALDASTGRTLWRNDEIRVICGAQEIALAQRGVPGGYGPLLFLDLRSGEILEELGDDMERAAAFQAVCSDSGRWAGWVSSEEQSEEERVSNELSDLLERSLRERRGPVEVAVHGGYTVAAAHVRSRRSPQAMLANAVDNVLLVVRDGRIVYSETIAKDAPGPVGDAFFIRHGILMFIREGTTLMAIDLNKE